MAWRLFDTRAPANIAMGPVGVYQQCPTWWYTTVGSAHWCLDCSTLLLSRQIESCASHIYMQSHVKVCGPWNILNLSPPGQNGRYFTEIYLNAFSLMKIVFYSNFTEVYSQVYNWQYARMTLGNGLVSNRQPAITWTNADPVPRIQFTSVYM